MPQRQLCCAVNVVRTAPSDAPKPKSANHHSTSCSQFIAGAITAPLPKPPAPTHQHTPFLPSSRCGMRRLKNPALRHRHHHHRLLYTPFCLEVAALSLRQNTVFAAPSTSAFLVPRCPRPQNARLSCGGKQHSRIADSTGEVSSRKCVRQLQKRQDHRCSNALSEETYAQLQNLRRMQRLARYACVGRTCVTVPTSLAPAVHSSTLRPS
jgi:hypothetical protein